MTAQPVAERPEISWLSSVDDLRAIQHEWRELANRTGADFYLWPDWFFVWWKHFGQGRTLACIVLRQNGDLVGILPFCLETRWLGPLPIRSARLAGTDPHCIVLKLPIENEIGVDILQESLTYLLKDKARDVVSFTPVSDLSALAASAKNTDQPYHLKVESLGSHVVFDLPETFDEFLMRLSKKRRAQFRRDVRALDEQFSMQSRVVFPDAESFQDFVDFHNLQWQSVGKGGHFCDWPGSVHFYQEMADTLDPKGNIQLHELIGNNGPLSTQFALVSGTTCHWRLPARSIDPKAEKLSIGKVGLLLMIKQLIEDGIQRIEAGMGEYDYKISYGGTNVGLSRVVVCPDTAVGRFRLSLLLKWSNLLDLAHYRIWFKKLAPRVRKLTGRRPRALWKSWIRTRF